MTTKIKPYFEDNRPTIIDFVEKYTHRFGDHVYLREKVDGKWLAITQEQTRREAHRIGAGLMALGIQKGERIAQLGFFPVCRAVFTEEDELDETERGSGGFGHTGV